MEIVTLYEQFRQSLFTYIRHKVRSKEDAEDILQNVFIKIAGSINKLDDEEKLKSWVYTITKNSIIDYYRVNSSKQTATLDDTLVEALKEDETTDSTKGLDQCLGSMINLLPEDYRDIIIDSEIKGIRQKELAERYGMAYPSMRSRVQRGRERLKQLFYNCCNIEVDKRGNILSAQQKNNCENSCDSCSE
jgi:RNA polymerase sigma-70 factor (ECF subfamily)